MSERRTVLLVRLKPEDREAVRRLAEKYDLSESDILRMALREFLKKHNGELFSS